MKIVFALPGREYSREFLICWSDLLVQVIKKGYEFVISQQYSAVVHFARIKCLGGNVFAGSSQKPFQGKFDYDVIMWIDSDIVFKPDDFFKLLESPHDVTAGMYMTADLKNFAIVKNWDEEYFKKNGTFEFLTQDTILNQRYIEVAYAGMGWMLIKKGAIEDLEYPWFRSEVQKIDDMVDISSEDVSFCRSLKKAGHPVMLDTTIRVGHLKSIAL